MTRPAILNDRRYTYADYLKFPEDERWEIIDGVAYLLEGSPDDRDARAMAPSPAFEHQSVSTELVRQIGNQLLGKPCRVVSAPLDVRLDTSNENASVVQPDVMVICDVSKITRQGVSGAPDWIIEVLSPATAGRDHIVKRDLYERHGVREYWLVHPIDRVVTVYRDWADGRYGSSAVIEMRGTLAVTAVPGIEIDWDLWQPLDSDPA